MVNYSLSHIILTVESMWLLLFILLTAATLTKLMKSPHTNCQSGKRQPLQWTGHSRHRSDQWKCVQPSLYGLDVLHLKMFDQNINQLSFRVNSQAHPYVIILRAQPCWWTHTEKLYVRTSLGASWTLHSMGFQPRYPDPLWTWSVTL